MVMILKTVLTLSLLLFISACSTTRTLLQPDLPEENGLGLQADESASDTEVALDNRVTVIVDVYDQDFSLAKSAQLRTLLTSKLIGDLNEVGVDDVNRKALNFEPYSLRTLLTLNRQ